MKKCLKMKKWKILLGVFILISLIILSQTSLSFSLAEYNLTYDGNGNLIQGFNKYYEYNGFNQLKYVRENNVSGRIISQYFYDADGNRIEKIDFKSDGGNETVYYIGKDFIQIVNNSGVFNETYYYDETDLIAKKDSNGKNYYYHPDQLGSTNIVTNESGYVVENTSYQPYGEIIEGGNSRYLYTGKEKDNGGLYYYGARYYDPNQKQFIQPDPIINDVYDPQSLNRYSYVRNNPYKYTDPNGEWIETAIDIGFIGYDISQLHTAEGRSNWVNWASLGLDVGCAILPIATGGGALFRGGTKLYEGTRAVDKIKDVEELGRGADKFFDVGKGGEIFTKSSSLRGAANPTVKEAAMKGQQIHKTWDYGSGFEKEIRLSGGKYRVDAIKIDYDTGTGYIKELKPNNPQAIARGEKQLEEYAWAAKEKFTDITKWVTEVVTYG